MEKQNEDWRGLKFVKSNFWWIKNLGTTRFKATIRMDTDWNWNRNSSQTFRSLENLLANLEFAHEIGTRTVGY